MTGFDDDFTSDLFASDDPSYDGARLLFARAGVEITTADLVTAVEAEGALGLDRLSEMCLVLGLEPRLVRSQLGPLLLKETLFAFEEENGALWLFLPGVDGTLSCLDVDGVEPSRRPTQDARGRVLVFPENVRSPGIGRPGGALSALLGPTTKPVLAVVGLTFASNVLGLALPLFTLAVYDQVLAAGDGRMLSLLVFGFGLGLMADALIRLLRSKIISSSAAYFDARISSRLFGTSLRQAAGFSLAESPSDFGRLRDLDRIRSFLFGPIGIGLVEAPFTLIYVIVLVLLLGWVAIVPIGFLVAGFGIAMVLLSSITRSGRAAMARTEDYFTLCREIAGRLGAIQTEGAEAGYESRFRDASARLAEAELLQQRTASAVQLVSSILVSLAVLLSLAVGALVAMEGMLTVGALIASIALVWRLSGPLPALMQAGLRWSEMKVALASTRELLDTGSATPTRTAGSSGGRAMSGHVVLSSVNFSYGRGQTAALRNLSFEIAAGELVAVTGHAGAGKSTLLDLLGGLLAPQFGSLLIDGVNPQQVAPSTLRQSIGYLPRDGMVMALSIRDYLRLGVDPADRDEIAHICERLGLSAAIDRLPEGDRTEMSALDQGSGLAQGLGLARTLATNANLLLLDEPDAASATARAGLLAELHRLRGQSTVVIVTHEPRFIEIADKLIILNAGGLARICAPKDIARRQTA